MRTCIILGACLIPLFAEAQIFKCTEADGRVAFSYEPCKSESGASEYIEVQTNELGTFATPEQVEQQRLNRETPVSRSQQRVTVVTDSATEDQSTLDGIVNKRLRLKEEALERQRGPNTSGVTVVRDSGSEGQADKAYRLNREAAALRGALPAVVPARSDDFDSGQLEINTREVPYVIGQDPNKRYLQQIQNKIDDPRPADGSTSSCVEGKPGSGAITVRGEDIWPGMRSHEVRRLIGSPDSVNSIIVGQEQWAYRSRSGGTTYVRVNGLCVSAIE